MIQVTKQFRAEICHRLQHHPGACRNLHGHSYLFEITASGLANQSTGMVLDFKELKGAIEETIGYWDHAVLLQENDPLCGDLEKHNITFFTTPGPPTAEWMAAHIACQVQKILLANRVRVEQVRVWETATSYADWKRGDCGC